jgi:hypothetical protein
MLSAAVNEAGSERKTHAHALPPHAAAALLPLLFFYTLLRCGALPHTNPAATPRA